MQVNILIQKAEKKQFSSQRGKKDAFLLNQREGQERLPETALWKKTLLYIA